jgi:hypothetical protein
VSTPTISFGGLPRRYSCPKTIRTLWPGSILGRVPEDDKNPSDREAALDEKQEEGA